VAACKPQPAALAATLYRGIPAEYTPDGELKTERKLETLKETEGKLNDLGTTTLKFPPMGAGEFAAAYAMPAQPAKPTPSAAEGTGAAALLTAGQRQIVLWTFFISAVM